MLLWSQAIKIDIELQSSAEVFFLKMFINQLPTIEYQDIYETTREMIDVTAKKHGTLSCST